MDKNISYVLGALHTIYNSGNIIENDIKELYTILSKNSDIIKRNKDVFLRILRSAQSIKKVAKYGLNTNIDLSSVKVKQNICDFIKQYIDYAKYKIEVNIENKDHISYICKFNTVTLGIIIDNIIQNSMRAGARTVNISYLKNNDKFQIIFHDDGRGLEDYIDEEQLFSFGYSTTSGMGIGLYHIKKMMNDMKGTVFIDNHITNGFCIILEFGNGC